MAEHFFGSSHTRQSSFSGSQTDQEVLNRVKGRCLARPEGPTPVLHPSARCLAPKFPQLPKTVTPAGHQVWPHVSLCGISHSNQNIDILSNNKHSKCFSKSKSQNSTFGSPSEGLAQHSHPQLADCLLEIHLILSSCVANGCSHSRWASLCL